MLNDLRRIFRTSIEAFRAELGRREPEDQVADLLTAMRREMVAGRALIREIELLLGEQRQELASEQTALTECERRGGLAARIGDQETELVARGFAARHRERIAILEQKIGATTRELELRNREVAEMRTRDEQAEVNRFMLIAELKRRAAADDGKISPASTFDDFDRMADRIQMDSSIIDALDELDADTTGTASPDPHDIERRLAELKKRQRGG